jgi:photosystem II stability/assembly factor-like uncharacterized protein
VLRKAAPPVLFFLSILLTLTAAPPGAAAAVDPGLLAGMKARSIGPAGMSGRIAAIEGVESNPDVVYVGTASGGVWKTMDGGDTWVPLFDDQPVASIGAVAVFQANPDIVWVGTGEGNPRNSVSVGNGVYRSLDAGKTWTRLGLENTERIHRIVLHPTNPDVAWVAALGKAWADSPDRGVYKTEDGGKTWARVLFIDDQTGANDVVIDPRNPNKLLASVWTYRRWPWFFKSGGPGSGLHVTWDGGRTWRKLAPEDGLPAGDLGRIGLGMSRSNPDVVYAMTEAKKSALLRSEDGGRTWKTVNDRYDVDPRPFYFGDVRVDPALSDRVYSLANDVRVSNDGGRTFEKLIDGNVIHGDFHALWIDPRSPEHLLVGGDGGVGISHDRGRTARFVTNLPVGQFYHVAVDMQQPYNVYGGLQDNGSWRGPSAVWQGGGIRNHHWLDVGTGDGFETLPDLGDPRFLYSEAQNGNLGRYEMPTGQTRDIRPPQPATPQGVRLRFNWNAALATDPFHPGTLYLGSQFLHKSTDRGETWTIVSPDLTTNNPEWQKNDESGGLTPDVSGAEAFTTIITIAPSPLKDGVIWIGTDDGRVHVTRDGGKSWESVEKNVKGVPASTWVPAICPSKHDPASAFAVFDNHRRSDWTPYVYRTDDWGRTWKRVTDPGAVRGYALSIEQDPVDRDLLFLGTEFGLWVSFDAGAHWLPWRHGLPTVSVMDLVIHPREQDLVIGTHGRALYILDDIRPLRAMTEKVLAEPLHLFEIADTVQHAVRPEDSGFALGFSEYRGENRPYGALLTYSLNQPGLPLPDAEKERERKEKERAAERLKAPAESTAPSLPRTAEDKPQPKPEAAGTDKKADEKPQVEIRITDTAGKLVRHFKQPATLGVNRAAWNLKRDAGKPFPSEGPPPVDPAGLEVAPGTYGVTVQYGGHESKGTVRVLADPRSSNSAADWQAREAAIARADALLDTASEAVDRIRTARADVDVVLAKAKKGQKDQSHQEDPPLVKAGQALQEKLTALERRLWNPYDAVGLLPENDLQDHINYARGYVSNTWAPPSPTHLEYLRQAEQETAALIAEVNRLFDTGVAEFRRQVEAAKVGLLPAMGKLEVKKP